MSKNKIKYGLKNVHYAVVYEGDDGTVTYGTPVHISGAVSLSLEAAGEPLTFYADDGVYHEENTNDGYTGSLEMALIPDEFRVDVLGDEIDSNGALIENKDAKSNKFALMFEFDGDQHKVRHVLYRVVATRPNVASATKTNTKEPQTDSMNITVRPAPDTGDVKAKVKQDDPVYNTFYSAVYLKDAPTNTVTQQTVTFSKAAPSDVEIEVTSTDATNSIKNVLLQGIPIPGASLTVAGMSVTIASDYVGALAEGSYVVTVEPLRGNAVIVTLTVTA
jgi:phi13 family phage major tail protein